jgi:hypothetical protein
LHAWPIDLQTTPFQGFMIISVSSYTKTEFISLFWEIFDKNHKKAFASLSDAMDTERISIFRDCNVASLGGTFKGFQKNYIIIIFLIISLAMTKRTLRELKCLNDNSIPHISYFNVIKIFS